jgi:hypothetical protein
VPLFWNQQYSDLGAIYAAAGGIHSITAAARLARLGYSDPMTSLSYRGHRFPAAIIQHAIWLYLWTIPA